MKLSLKGWRTRLTAFAVFLVGLIQLYDPSLWATLAPSKYQPFIVIGLGVFLFILRQYTNTPPGKKDT